MKRYLYNISYSLNRGALLGITLIVLIMSVPPLFAQQPKALTRELNRWIAAVEDGNAESIAALLGDNGIILIRFHGHPVLKSVQLNREDLVARLERGEANILGLSKRLLLPRLADMRQLGGGRYSFTDSRCPEVTWIFVLTRGRWRLIEIIRRFLEC